MALFNSNQLEDILGNFMRLTSASVADVGIDLAQDSVLLIKSIDVDTHTFFQFDRHRL